VGRRLFLGDVILRNDGIELSLFGQRDFKSILENFKGKISLREVKVEAGETRASRYSPNRWVDKSYKF